ncbi:MAG TPA: CYTH and CHAD domain-containing protein [Acidimicrobiales bacterium]|nr:CYTH and CHAD domain-containing protein [Acidimicrobiales bacterium]
MSTEREVKLIAPPDLELPSMEGLAPAVVAVAAPTRWLDAVYHDTADLRLARAGVTLRHRSGEEGLPWTLKLPGSSTGSQLVRSEIGFGGDPVPVPREAADVVLARTRAATLAPVARLRTERRVTELRDRTGPVAEVVDDRVTVEGPAGAPAGFREIEIEVLADSAAANAVLRAATDRLVAAGCVAETPVPKLVRALGDAASGPADVVVNAVGPDATVLELARASIAASVDRLVSHDAGVRLGDDPEDVHQFRVAARRLRAHLRTFSPMLDGAWVAELRGELSWIAGTVGALRDADVFGARLQVLAASVAPEDAGGVELLLGEVAARAAGSRADALEALRSSRYVSLVDALVAAASSPVLAAPGDAHAGRAAARDVSRWVGPAWRRLSRQVARLGDDPPDWQLHRVRILAKRCRYAAEAFIPVCGKDAARFAAGMAGLQTVLGDLQDTVVGEDWLRAAASGSPESAVAAGQLIAAERAERRRLSAAWPAVWEKAADKRRRRWLD